SRMGACPPTGSASSSAPAVRCIWRPPSSLTTPNPISKGSSFRALLPNARFHGNLALNANSLLTNSGQMMNRYPRDMHGYGPNPPNANWPGGAHVAVQFVLNYEEGGENNILHGDAAS